MLVASPPCFNFLIASPGGRFFQDGSIERGACALPFSEEDKEMTKTKKWIGAFCLSAIGGLLAGPALAQTATEPATGQSTVERARQTPATPGAATRPGAARTATASAGDNLDQKIAVCLLLGNQEEVALAQFAQQRSQNEQVRKFAQQMIEHHQQAISKIEQAAPEAASLNLQLRGGTEGEAAASTNASGVRPASAEEPVATTASAANTGSDQRGVQLAQSVKQECLNLTQQELAQKQGAEFDKAYIGQQIGAHIGMLAELRGSKNFATDQLQQVITEGEQMTQKHLAEAKQIMSQLKDQQGSQPPQTSRRPATTQPAR
jgi:predicted outer membrane protein